MSKELMKQITTLMVTAALLVLAVMYSEVVLKGVATCFGIIKPFIIGGAIAFVLNIPLTKLEKGLLSRFDGTKQEKVKRPLSILLTIVLMFAIIILVTCLIVPNLAETVKLVVAEVPDFLDRAIIFAEKLDIPGFNNQAAILETINDNWDGIVQKVGGFLQTGLTSVLGSTVQIVSRIVSTVVNFFVAFVFAIYILARKEILADQFNRVIKAYIKPKPRRKFLRVVKMLNKNFYSFIAGQCMDAMILGGLFVITLTILRMPYALMIGILIAITALIPIVGAFIGAVVGAFLILMVSPVKALIFLIVFVVLQQLEGNLIYPRIVGNSVGLPAMWVLAAITVGGSLMGVAGMLLFIPITSTIYALLRDDVNKRIAAKGTSGNL